jgi:hypothetical protein
VTVFSELHYGNRITAADLISGQDCEYLLLENPHPDTDLWWVLAQPSDQHKPCTLRVPPDQEVIVSPTPAVVWWLSINEAAERLWMTAHAVLAMAVTNEIAARREFDHWVVSRTAVDRLRLSKLSECGASGDPVADKGLASDLAVEPCAVAPATPADGVTVPAGGAPGAATPGAPTAAEELEELAVAYVNGEQDSHEIQARVDKLAHPSHKPEQVWAAFEDLCEHVRLIGADWRDVDDQLTGDDRGEKAAVIVRERIADAIRAILTRRSGS